MNLALFSIDGLLMVLRWMHFFFGIIWIGHLYYFNFTQGPFFNETDAATKSGAIQKLVPRALWWFRYGALWTAVTGLLYLGAKWHQSAVLFEGSWGVWILTGSAIALVMAANVWFVIWPNQQVVIASATAAAQGKPALPEAASAGAKALLASRHNVMFSIPMLFCMGAASHLPLDMSGPADWTKLGIALLVIIGGLEFNALKGKLGPLASVKGVIQMGFVLFAVIYGVIELIC
jgi:uncharacterized membrane protein